MSTLGDMLVLLDFQGQQEDELKIKVGEVIRNVKKTAEEGWLEGELNGKRGFFPQLFAKDIPSIFLNDNGQRYPRSMRKANTCIQKTKQRWCKAHYSYSPGKQDELELFAGEVIEVLEEIEDGWWLGKKGDLIGAFPSNFVQEIAESPSDKVPELKKNKQRPKMMEYTFTPKDGEKGKPQDKATARNQKDSITPAPAIQEFCRAMFDYVPSLQDELALRKGDVVLITNKETGDEGWWQGELNGKSGFFPDNFVILLPPTSHINTNKPPMRTPTVKVPAKVDVSTVDKAPADKKAETPSTTGQKAKIDIPTTDKEKPDVNRPVSPASVGQKAKFEKTPVDKKNKDVKRPESPASSGQKAKTDISKGDKKLSDSPTTTGQKGKMDAPATIDKKLQDVNAPESPSFNGHKDQKETKTDPAPKLTHQPAKKFAPPPPVPIKTKSNASPGNKLNTEPQTKHSEDGKDKSKDTNTLEGLRVSSVRLAHPTAERPKMQGKRPPKTKLTTNHTNYCVENSFYFPEPTSAKAVPKSSTSSSQVTSPTAKASTQPPSFTSASKRSQDSAQSVQVEELAAEIKTLKLMMEMIQSKHLKDMEDIRGEIHDEKVKRLALQMEIENLKKLSS
ncbi:LOW QUALITY PROTEIN: SH3 domain-containing protein 21 [Pelodytes ibericus]